MRKLRTYHLCTLFSVTLTGITASWFPHSASASSDRWSLQKEMLRKYLGPVSLAAVSTVAAGYAYNEGFPNFVARAASLEPEEEQPLPEQALDHDARKRGWFSFASLGKPEKIHDRPDNSLPVVQAPITCVCVPEPPRPVRNLTLCAPQVCS